MKRFITYCRVSTKMQGRDGLGMEAQKETVRRFVEAQGGEIVGEFLEVESGSKTDAERPELAKALALCRKKSAVFLCARIDRLSRNAAFLLTLQNAGVEMQFADAPSIDRFSVGILALVADRERHLISERTRAALAAAKARGTRLGGARFAGHVALANAGARLGRIRFREKMLPVIEEIRSTGVSTLQGIADCLNRRGITTRTGKTTWFPGSVRNLLT